MYIDVKDIPDLLLQASTGAGLTVGARLLSAINFFSLNIRI